VKCLLGRSGRRFAIPMILLLYHTCHLRNLLQGNIIPTVNDILIIVMERQSVSRPYSDKFVAGSSDYDLFAFHESFLRTCRVSTLEYGPYFSSIQPTGLLDGCQHCSRRGKLLVDVVSKFDSQ
jgi:hypothetical protein